MANDGPGRNSCSTPNSAPTKEAPPKVTPEQHQAAITSAEQRGYQRGLAAAEAQARTEAQRRTAAAHERIGRRLQSSPTG